MLYQRFALRIHVPSENSSSTEDFCAAHVREILTAMRADPGVAPRSSDVLRVMDFYNKCTNPQVYSQKCVCFVHVFQASEFCMKCAPHICSRFLPFHPHFSIPEIEDILVQCDRFSLGDIATWLKIVHHVLVLNSDSLSCLEFLVTKLNGWYCFTASGPVFRCHAWRIWHMEEVSRV